MFKRIKLEWLRFKLRNLVNHEEELRIVANAYLAKSRILLREDIPALEREVSALEAEIFTDDGGFA